MIIQPIAEKYQIPAIYLFGSYARGTATDESDIDLLVDITGTSLTSLFSLGALY
ncbi:MAG: nucleotidyltransferase family protein [Oscillospiraceae bacterium]